MRRDEFRNHKGERRENNNDQRGNWLQKYHEDDGSRDCDDSGEELREPEQESVGELFDVGNDTAQEVSGRV